MRNLKRALSLALASVMLLGMMVVGTSAASYPDVDEKDNVEAIEVLNAVNVMIGRQGNFEPDEAVNRHEMAVIMAKLVLGVDTADNYVGSHPFTDVVPWADKYVAACYENGLVSGTSATTFSGSKNLTAVEAAAMMLRALGYKDLSKGATDWRAPVTAMANQIRLFSGVASNPSQQLNRNQVAQLALNTLKSPVVDLKDNTFDVTSGDGAVVISGGSREYIVRSSSEAYARAINRTEYQGTSASSVGGYTIELGEHLYDGKLRLEDDTDVFGRPARQWLYDGKEIGTYAKEELLRKTWTAKVTGKDLYDLLGTSTLRDYEEYIFVDGESAQSVLGSYYFDENNMIRTNTNAVGGTGKGVLTEVYVDSANKEITIAIINTYLAKATKDYDAKNNEARFTVYNVKGTGGTSTYVKAKTDGSARVSDEDFALIKDVKEDDLYLVTLAQGEVQSMVKPEVLDSTTISSFSRTDWVSANGTKYEYASTARYDVDVLDEYDNKNMKDLTYNVILDKYGYLIGLELNEDPDQYVFLTGIEGDYSNLGTRNVDGNIIFLDGTMKTVTINGKDSELKIPATTNNSQVNAWYTYSVNSDGTYVLERVADGTRAATTTTKAIKVAQSAQSVGGAAGTTMKINQRNNVGLDADAFDVNSTVKVAYGNKDTVYLGVSTTNIIADHTLNGQPRVIIDDVETISTGVTNVDLLVKELGTTKGSYNCPDNEVYTLYKDNGAVIAVVAIGEDNGAGSNLVFITGNGVNQEDDNGKTGTRATGDGKYTWYLKAIVAGEDEERSITEVGNNASILKRLARNTWYELRFDADGNVRKVDEDSAKDANKDGYYDGVDFSKAKFLNAVTGIVSTVPNEDTVLVQDKTTVTALRYVGNTLYTTTDNSRGFPVAENVESFLVLAGGSGNGRGSNWFDDVRDEYHGADGLKSALDDMNAANKNPLPTVTSGANVEGVTTTTTVQVSAILKNGVATTVIINDLNANPAKNPGNTGNQTFEYTPEVTQRGNFLDIKANTNDADGTEVWTGAYNWLVANGYNVVNASIVSGNWQFYASRDGQNYIYTTNLIPMVKVVIDGVTGFYQENVGLTFSGDYFQWGTVGSDRPIAGTLSSDTAAVPSSGTTWTPVWANNGNMEIWTGLYKVTLDHNGNSDAGTDVYYKMRETIKAGTDNAELQGNWYIVGASSVKAAYTKAADAADYAKFQPTKDLVMSEALKDKTIYDHYYNIKVNKTVASSGDDTAIDEYVINGTSMTAMDGTGGSNATLKDADGTYVATTSGKITIVDRDFDIVDAGYVRIVENVTVNTAGSSGMPSGAKLVGKVAPNTYVKTGETFTVTFSLEDVSAAATGDVKIATSSAITVGTKAADVATEVVVIKNGEKTLNVVSIEITAPASMSSGAVAITTS